MATVSGSRPDDAGFPPAKNARALEEEVERVNVGLASEAEEETNINTTATTPQAATVSGSAGAVAGNGHHLTVSSPEKPGMSDELKDIFNKLIDDQGHLDMRNVTTLIWVNRKKPQIVEAIVELLIENSKERRVFNGIEFYLPQLAHMIVHLDVHLPTSALEQFALVVCQQSLHVALQLNWILVAALEDYHAERPDGTRNKKANTVYFNRCAKLLQNVERIIALGAPSATGLEELYKTGKLSRHEVEARTIADRRRQAEKVIGSPKKGTVPVADEVKTKGWLWHKRWHKRGFPHHSKWIRRWFEVEDRVLYCYNAQGEEGNKVKRAAVLYQATVKVCDYKNGRYPHYFEVHSPMGNMRLRADDAAGREAWVINLQKQSQAMPSVAHLYASEGGASSSSLITGRDVDSPVGAMTTSAPTGAPGIGTNGNALEVAYLPRPGSIIEGNESSGAESSDENFSGTAEEDSAVAKVDGAIEAVAGGGKAMGLVVSATPRERQQQQPAVGMSMSTVVLQEAKRNRRFKFFSEERKFVSDLCDVCESLRFEEDRSKRGEMLESLLAKVHIPACGYLPLCRSTEPFQRVLRITPNEAKAFSTKERVPAMVTFETEQTWAPHMRSPGSPPLDVASFLTFVYGFHAPMHQDQQRYSSIALRGGEDSIMEPDRLEVSESGGEDTSMPGIRHSRSGSFRFRAGSKGLAFPHMPPVHLPSNFTSVWRDRPAGTGAAKAKEARGSKSPFRHNFSSLGSALHARASSIRNVKLPGVRQSISKKGPGVTPGSVVSISSLGEEKDGDPAGVSDGLAVAWGEEGTAGKAKNVAWEDNSGEKVEVGEKQTTAREESSGLTMVADTVPAFAGRSAEEEKKEEGGGIALAVKGAAVAGKSHHSPMDSGNAFVVDDAGLDKALREPSLPRSRSQSNSYISGSLEEITLPDDSTRGAGVGRSVATDQDGDPAEEEQLRTPCKAYGESMATKAKRIRNQSSEGGRAGWTLQRLILKSNDDVRQEVFVMQLIIFYKEVFEREGLDLWLKPYSILSTAKTTGLIEVLNQSTSIDGLKKSESYPGSLLEHFYAVYGSKDTAEFKAAQRRFACSLAGYSVISYLLGIKDRHNGNVMVDSDGHIVHIDFGFVLGSAPGGAFSMERAAFKFTPEYLAVLGGKGSDLYEEFVGMFTKGLLAARKYASVTVTLIEIMMFQSEFPCFEYMGDAALTGFKKKLMLGATESDVTRRARRMVENANGSWGTCFYDKFQLWTNGIMP